MELELCMQKFPCFQAGKMQSDLREFRAETVIPDYAPDISRIVESSAAFYIHQQERSDDRITISGTAKINTLYMAEEDAGLKRFEYVIPIEQSFGRTEEAETVFVETSVCRIEVRALNPRKLSSQIGLLFVRHTYTPAECALCCDVEKEESYGIQTLKESKTVSFIKALREKEFVFEEELTLSAAKEPIAELLRTGQTLCLDECKILGSKVMVKGSADLSILYLTESGCLQQLSTQLPFSQIIDGCESEAELCVNGKLRLRDAEYCLLREGGAAPRGIAVKLFADAFAVICEKRTVECISDLYSTSHRLDCESAPGVSMSDGKTFLQEENIRESIEVGAEIDSLLAAEVLLSPTNFLQTAAQKNLRIPYTAKVLYCTNSGSPYCVERQGEADVTLPPLESVEVSRMEGKQISALPTAGGIELRFTLALTLEERKNAPVSVLTRLTAAEDRLENVKAPSVVLRRKNPGQSLWSLAKEYRTTQADILSANSACEESQLLDGQMLLIPKKR